LLHYYLIDLNQCITFQLIKYMLLFAFAFAFDEFWKSKYAFDECEFWPAASYH